jgi:hypothetical protein
VPFTARREPGKLAQKTTVAGAAGCCSRLRALLENPAGGPGPHGPLHVYFGIAAHSPDASSVKALLRRAEDQLERGRLGVPEGQGL